jgi:hypothetical protein
MMVYLLDLKFVLWFIHEPLVDYLGDGKHDGYHPTWFLFGDIELSLWCSCGMSRFVNNGTCWVA